MKIEKIELRHIKMELISPFTTSMGTEYDEEHIIVRVDGEGFTGWGESVAEGTPFYSYETVTTCLLYTSPSPRDRTRSRMPSSA